MGEQSRIIRKFERMIGHSHEELMEIGRKNRTILPSESAGEIIGTFTYNFNTGQETFTPSKAYKNKTDKYNSTEKGTK